MKLALLCFIVLISPFILHSQTVEVLLEKLELTHKKGSLHSYAENTGEILELPITRGGSALPSSASLKKFIPEVINQQGGSCVSYSSAYYGMTAYLRYNQNSNELLPCNPLDLHGRILSFYNSCDDINQGSNPIHALTLLRDYGVNSIVSIDSILWLCNNSNPFDQFPSKLSGWKMLNNTRSNINSLKYALSTGHPVVTGVSTNLSLSVYSQSYFFLSELIQKNEKKVIDSLKKITPEDCLNLTNKEIVNEILKIKKIKPGEDICWSGKPPTKNIGGHAMCIVGYDDTKFGGAFEIVNSWGDDWGNNGFLWIKYNDLYSMFPTFFMIGK